MLSTILVAVEFMSFEDKRIFGFTKLAKRVR